MTIQINITGREIQVSGKLLRVARIDAEKFRFLSNPAPLIEGLKRSGTRVDLFTFIQGVSETTPKYPYPMEWDNLAVLPVSTFEHWWTKQIGFKARNKAKQAEKRGVTIREIPFGDALVEGIWQIYNECPIRQGRPFRHYGKDINTVRQEEATFLDSSTFIGAFVDDRLIGFIKLLTDETRTQSGLLNIVSMICHRDKAPTNALVAYAVRFCAENRIPFLVYSNFAYGNKQRDSVSDFKERNGFLRVEIPRYYVSLTRFGALAFRFGFHHKLADRVPEAAIGKLREIRRAWYERKSDQSVKHLRREKLKCQES